MSEPKYRLRYVTLGGWAVEAKVIRMTTRWWLWDRVEYTWAPVYRKVCVGHHVPMSGYFDREEAWADLLRLIESGGHDVLVLDIEGLQPEWSEPV